MLLRRWILANLFSFFIWQINILVMVCNKITSTVKFLLLHCRVPVPSDQFFRWRSFWRTKFSHCQKSKMWSDSCVPLMKSFHFIENLKNKNHTGMDSLNNHHVSWLRNFTRLLHPGYFNLTVLDTALSAQMTFHLLMSLQVKDLKF